MHANPTKLPTIHNPLVVFQRDGEICNFIITSPHKWGGCKYIITNSHEYTIHMCGVDSRLITGLLLMSIEIPQVVAYDI